MLKLCLYGVSLINLLNNLTLKSWMVFSNQLNFHVFISIFCLFLSSTTLVIAEEPLSSTASSNTASLTSENTMVLERSAVSDKQVLPMVIVNQSVGKTHLSLKKLRNIFAMKLRYWEEDQAINVFVLPKDHPVHAAFCKKTLNIFPNQLESVWYRQVYTGTGQAPIEVQSESELLERIANTPGAIGYVNKNNENIKRFSDDIKIIQIP